MTITAWEMENVKGIVLDGAKAHFPPNVQFHDANVAVMLNAGEEEFINVELLYTADNPVLDGHLMNTFFRVIDEPMRASGITTRTLVHYIEINDPTRLQSHRPPSSPSAAS